MSSSTTQPGARQGGLTIGPPPLYELRQLVEPATDADGILSIAEGDPAAGDPLALESPPEPPPEAPPAARGLRVADVPPRHAAGDVPLLFAAEEALAIASAAVAEARAGRSCYRLLLTQMRLIARRLRRVAVPARPMPTEAS